MAKRLVLAYCCVLFSTVAHELGHASAAWVNHIKVNRIIIGRGQPYFTFNSGVFGQVSFHPNIMGGLTMLDRQSLNLATLDQVMMVTMSGLLVNLFLLTTSSWLACQKDRWGCAFLAAVNSFMLFYNITPIFGTDGNHLLQMLIARGWIIMEADWSLVPYLTILSATSAIFSLGIMVGLFLRDLIPKIGGKKLQI